MTEQRTQIVEWTETSQQALDAEIRESSDDVNTVLNRAVQLYHRLAALERRKGAIYTREPGGELHREKYL